MKALVIVDYQVDFVDGALGFEKAKSLEPIIEEKIKKTLSDQDDIIFTLDTHNENYLSTKEGKDLPIIHCIKNTKGHQVYGSVAKYLDNAKAIFEKPTFGSVKLADFVKRLEYDEIEVCGLVTNMCVLSNIILIQANNPEIKITVDSKAVMSFSDELHQKTLDVLKGLFVEVI